MMFEKRPEILTSDLLFAIAKVESNCDDNKIGENGEIGRYQISQKYLDSANKILDYGWIKCEYYTLDDMKDMAISTFIVMTYLNYYASMYTRLYGKLPTEEMLIRTHKGGAKGYNDESTTEYYEKVKNVLKEIK